MKNLKIFFIILVSILALEIIYYGFFFKKKPLSPPASQPITQKNSIDVNELFIGEQFIGLSKKTIQELLVTPQNANKIILPVIPTEQTRILFFESQAKLGNIVYLYITNPLNNTVYHPTIKDITISNTALTSIAVKNEKIIYRIVFKLENTTSFQFPIKIPADNVGSVLFSSLTSYTPELTPAGNFEGVTNIPNKYVYISAPKFALKNIAEKDKEEFYKNFIFLKYNNRYVFPAE